MESYETKGQRYFGETQVPGCEDEALGAVLTELGDLVLLEDAEGLGGIVGAEQISGIEDVAEVVAGETVGVGVPGVEPGAE